MAKRYPFLSYNNEALDAFDADSRKLDQNDVTSGRVKYLKGISISNTHTSETGILQIYDYATEGGTPTATLQRLQIVIGPSETVVIDFAAPGIKFLTGILGGLKTNVGTFDTYSVTVWGYEE